jgi:hypothetical protein
LSWSTRVTNFLTCSLAWAQRWQKVADHLPLLAGKEPPDMTEGEEDEAEDKGERPESASDTSDFVRLPRGAKRGATSSSQGAPGEGALEDDEGEETTSPPEGKGPVKGADEPQSKRLRQTVLEGTTELRRPMKEALEAGPRVGPGVKAIPTVK